MSLALSRAVTAHRVVEVGRGLWRSSSPSPLLKQGHLEQVTQDYVQSGFEYLQGWTFHSSLGSFFQRTTLMVRQCFLMVRQNLLCLNLCPLPLVTGHHWEDPGSVVFTPFLQVFLNIAKTPLSHLFSRLSSPFSLAFWCLAPDNSGVPRRGTSSECGAEQPAGAYHKPVLLCPVPASPSQ